MGGANARTHVAILSSVMECQSKVEGRIFYTGEKLM